MSQLPARLACPLGLAALAAALLGACYDTPLIPDGALAAGGSAGHGGSTNAGGKPAASSGATSAGGKPAASSGAANDGGASAANPGGASSAGSAGQSAGTAGTTGQVGEGGAHGVTWLELSGNAAPASSPTNAALGIEGSFYAYADACSRLSWDDSTRCASGTLCDPANLDNWGMAVGFDFRNTGASGSPPNTKLIWDPDDYGAIGLAWRIRGNAPKVQVWVLNMASSWQGQCSAMTCEIAGPPDGIYPAPLNGELLFDNMVKDNWGGSGLSYQFNPAAVHALQIKLAAVQIGAVDFDFCIDALGIIR